MVLDNGTRFWILGRALDSEMCSVPTSHRKIVFTGNHNGKEIIVTQVRFQARMNKWMNENFIHASKYLALQLMGDADYLHTQ